VDVVHSLVLAGTTTMVDVVQSLVEALTLKTGALSLQVHQVSHV
jgi:hypothetical protein